MVSLRSLPLALVAAALALPTGACNRNKLPSQSPDDASAGIVLRYAVPQASLQQELALQLTRTRLGLYIEADLEARAELRLSERGSALETRWTVTDVPALTLDGTVEPGEADRVRVLLEAQGQGTVIGDAHGVLDGAATDADPVNVARMTALATEQTPPSAGGAILMTVLSEQLRLPRLPNTALMPGKPAEFEEESETVVTDADLVLPTTSVYRFTLRKVEPVADTRVAEVDLVVASVAQPEVDPELEPEDAEPAAELESRAEGTLVFDLDRNVPVSMELSRTDSLRIGDQEVEQTLQIQTSFAVSR
ncbi:MAG: hypothetical protein AAGF11_11285 [Myxococcota bacterium]